MVLLFGLVLLLAIGEVCLNGKEDVNALNGYFQGRSRVLCSLKRDSLC
jgi:hypothetical protein